MEHVIALFVLTAALAASGVLGMLVKLPKATAQSESRRDRGPSPPANSATTTASRRAPRSEPGRSPARSGADARVVGARRRSAGSARERRAPSEPTPPKSQLTQLAHRLSRLESALEAGEATLGRGIAEVRPADLTMVLGALTSKGLPSVEIARRLGVSQGEVELMIKMRLRRV